MKPAVFEFRDFMPEVTDGKKLYVRIKMSRMWHYKAGKRPQMWEVKKVYIYTYRVYQCFDQILTMRDRLCWPLRRRMRPDVWLISSVNVLMRFFNRVISLSLISPPLLCPSIQMGTAWDERISLYWPWLNAALMKAHADNSFFIMSLARLGISFSIAEREKFCCCFGWESSSFDWSLIVRLKYFFHIASLLD